MTLPIATLALLFSNSDDIESDTETASSGQLVPIATTVKPIINSDIWSFLAIVLAESTKISQNLTKQIVPTIKPTTKAIDWR